MSCRRAYDIDLAAFVAEPHAPELAEFVEHYPRCAECAAEVRVWTEVHLALAGLHPDPAELLAYHDGALGDDARARLARHLATCPACAEELRALGRFDATRPGAVTTTPAPRPGVAPVTARIGRLLWHPAVGYTLALLLLVPLLARRPRETATPARAPARADEVAPRVPDTAFRKQELARSAPPPAAAGSAAADAEARRETAAEQAASPGPTLDRDRRTLTLPLSVSLRGREMIEVRIRDAADARELRQRVTPPHAAESLVVDLPRDWLTPGAWTVELRAGTEVRRFPLRVP